MHKVIYFLFGIVVFTSIYGGSFVDSQSITNIMIESKNDSIILPNKKSNEKYICGFTGSFAYIEDIPIAAGLSSTNDSIIERTFTSIWINVIGGRPSSIRIEKDADQNNNEYKYAAAKGSFNDLGNINRYVFYKSNDLMPLLNQDDGWNLKAIALHEFAHHINGDPFTGVSTEIAELGADDYAGFMMGQGKLKTSIDTALLAFSNLTEENPTNGYPSRQKRIAAVKSGWERAQVSNKFSIISAFIAIETLPSLTEATKKIPNKILEQSINKNSSIKAWKDTSTSDKSKVSLSRVFQSQGVFFLDSSFLYVIRKDSTCIVGRVAQSNRPEYRQMVYDNFYNYMYLDNDNKLITYVLDNQNPKKSLKPIVIGSLSEIKNR